ncbi:heavy metal-binding domain-containing protein [Paenarthrobacter sp. Z7-10]|uniref:heavy metal-binding domain-containing protein n=1 Tax=Paenarthrobacter sp. Z7-10 TaxID=2787635 RepID=UPI0022A9DEFD|nr:heavy metal-binding domain-containing protein [Paenarthrobacter sp. Z7-10]MCZ2404574.1 heavy metal-binding domain-containing protein [Paenarthrobacter sp. Z7-10]
MKTRDIAKNHQLDPAAFDPWLKQSGLQYKSGITGLSIEDSVDVVELVGHYNQYLTQEKVRIAQEQERRALEQANAEQADLVKQQAVASMLISSGFNFEGYTITKYSGYISGDDAVSMDRPSHGWLGGVNKDVGADLLSGLAHIRRNALTELKDAAYALGCNAVIGVDFDYLTLDPETATSSGGTFHLPFLFAVTANGNAVVIEKNEHAGQA